MPKISVVIPCFNQGHFLEEAVDSVLSQTCRDFEIIIVNDGSTDKETNRLLANYCREKTRVVATSNQGLAAARNNGIREADGKYILPLDADDRIGPAYLEKAAAILDSNSEIGIVYCKGEYFGERSGEWSLPEYSLQQMLLNNVIFCTALFRRIDWEETGGFDTAMQYGWEDYDFWLSLIERGRKVHKIPDFLFYYRIRSESMLRSRSKEQKVLTLTNIFHKHELLYKKNIDVLFDRLLDRNEIYLEATFRIREKDGYVRIAGARKVDLQTKKLQFDSLNLHDDPDIEIQILNEKVIVNIKSVEIIFADRNRSPEQILFTSNAFLSKNSILFFNTK
ncbi:glycosyltransferase, partial [Desulfobulbus sp. F4]|nr:glycosyltransferase [Desulfobulbus sp. F4]